MLRRVCLQFFIAALAVTTASASGPRDRYEFRQPTDRYAHGVLGDAIEYGQLVWGTVGPGNYRFFAADNGVPDDGVVLNDDRVFEDISPRARDLDGDGTREALVVESHRDLGAQLAVYGRRDGMLAKIAATPHIGQRNRWLAPAGIADFDGDGQNDIAYVETPHLGKILKIVTLKGDQLVPIVSPRAGFSNHRIGQDFITSGVRQCNGRTELLTPNAHWTALMAVRIEGGKIIAEATPFEPSRAGVSRAQRCES